MFRSLIAVVLLAAAGLLTGCGGSSAPVPTVTNTVTNTVTLAAPTTAAPPAAVEPAPTGPAVIATTWTMPNLIGWNLQDAQDEIQRLSSQEIFYTGSTDLTGQARNQILDSNWQVCTSTPAPGAPITKDTVIDFGVVRVDIEDCP